MIETQPGEGRNDIMGLAFLIAFAAFLINGHQRRAPERGGGRRTRPSRDAPLLDKGPLIIAGIAAGLAASVKLTFLIPVGAIAIGVILFSGKGRRLTTAWVLGLSMLRRRRLLVRAGDDQDRRQPDPDDQLRAAEPAAAGPDAARPAAALRGRPLPHRPDDLPQAGSSRELDNAFGPLWPLILIIAVAAAVFIAVRSRNKILRVLAVAALLTAVVYVFTPLTAAGQEGSPTGFFTNTRYLVPGLVLAMVHAADRAAAAGARQARLADADLPHRRSTRSRC